MHLAQRIKDMNKVLAQLPYPHQTKPIYNFKSRRSPKPNKTNSTRPSPCTFVKHSSLTPTTNTQRSFLPSCTSSEIVARNASLTSASRFGEGSLSPPPRNPYGWLNDIELSEKMEKGLCFRCDEQYGPNHHYSCRCCIWS